MNTAVIAIPEARPLSALEIRAQVNLIQEVMEAVMVGPSKENPQGVHYGIIPGTNKPTLYKAGAEKLCMTFRIAPSYRFEDLSDGDSIRYRVTCVGTHQSTGITMGEGVGEASSNEEKYKWRKAICADEFAETPEHRRRRKYANGRNGVYRVDQVRTEPADIANTVLKMASKRAHMAMTLNVLAASDVFNQDIEDLPDEVRDEILGAEQSPGSGEATAGVKQPQRRKPESDPPAEQPKAPDTATISQGEWLYLTKKCETLGVKLEDVANEVRITDITKLTKDGFAAIKDALMEKERG